MTPSRSMPSAEDAEKGVLASALLAPVDVCGLASAAGITDESFYIPAHSEIWRAVTAIVESGKPVDFITLANWLKDRNKLDSVGGGSAISELFHYLPTAANAQSYIETVKSKEVQRRVIMVCEHHAGNAYSNGLGVPELLDSLEESAMAIRPQQHSGLVTTRAATMEAVKNIQKLYEQKGKITGLSTGLRDLDIMIDGLHPADMVVIAARPSCGKTAIAMRMAEHIAVEEGLPVAIFSLEMSTQQLFQRILLGMARINAERVRNGFMSEMDMPKLTAAATRLARSNIWVDDAGALSIQEMRARARRMKRDKGIKAIFVDYLQIATSTKETSKRSEQAAIADVSMGCKAMAKELEVPVVALAQLNRNPEDRSDGRPRLADLRQSGQIEQDADVVGLLHRPEMYAQSDTERAELDGQATLIIAKQRSGAVGDVPLTFLKEYARYESRA